ncbi:MAG: M1 family metallopeptidase [Polyangiales bacterium]
MLRRARLLVALLALASAAPSPTRAEPDPPPLPASAHRYVLTARLDEAARAVTGEVEIAFTNTSRAPLDSLTFHLYLNAFRDRHSVFMRESGGSLRGKRSRGTGSLVLETLTVDGQDVLAGAERELVADDQTQLRAALPAPLAPGASVRIASRFVAKLPPLFARSGWAPDFFVVAQWFPKLATLAPDGRFVSTPYHALGEFYADFADYTLTLDAPADMQVAASGERGDTENRGGRTLHRFEARHVHDFAFVAARGYREDVESVDGVLVRYLAPASYGWAMPAHARVVREGLRHYGAAFGRYPYPTLSVVLPPAAAEGGAGMEYPTLFLGDPGWWTGTRLPALLGPFVTAHELAHQWFQGMLASDEVHYPVLDEGLAQWASLDLIRTLYGPREGLEGVLALDRFEVTRAIALKVVGSIAPGLPAPAYTAREYGGSVYARAALALECIRRAYGKARFDAALARYAEAHRFGHPTPGDLEAAFDDAYGPGFGGRVLRPLLFEGASTRVQMLEARSDERGPKRHVTRIRARRQGVALPTWLALYDADGRELTRVRFGAEAETLLTTLETPLPVARAVLDPDRALLLDDDVTDQIARFDAPAQEPLLAALVAIGQLLLAGIGP